MGKGLQEIGRGQGAWKDREGAWEGREGLGKRGRGLEKIGRGLTEKKRVKLVILVVSKYKFNDWINFIISFF